MSTIPSFMRPGASGSSSGSRYLKLESGKKVSLVCLTGVEPPDGEVPTGSNCVLSYNQFVVWLDDLAEGQMSPMFPSLGGPSDPGLMLGLKPNFRALMLVSPIEDGKPTEEKVWAMGVSVFRQLCDIEQSMGSSLRGTVINVMRSGEGRRTKYTVVPTAKKIKLDGMPTTDLVDAIGPKTRREIVEMLTEAGLWPPKGGDPYAGDDEGDGGDEPDYEDVK